MNHISKKVMLPQERKESFSTSSPSNLRIFVKIFITLMLISSSLAFGSESNKMNPDDAMEIIKINQGFSQKEILTNPSLCAYHNELVEIAKTKYSVESFTCPRNEGSKTQEEQLNSQLKNIDQVMQLTSNDKLDPETEDFLDRAIINLPRK